MLMISYADTMGVAACLSILFLETRTATYINS